MDPNQQTFAPQQIPPTIPQPIPQPKRKKNIFLRIILILVVIVVLYVVIGFILIAINPLFGWIVLSPVFTIQSMLGMSKNAALKNDLEELPQSKIALAATLTSVDCIGLFGTDGFGDPTYPGIREYAEKLDAKEFGQTVGVCNTSKGIFVVKSSYQHGGETYLNELYIDNVGELKKVLEYGETMTSFAEDADGNVILLTNKDAGPNISRNPFIYDVASQSFMRPATIPDVFKVCSKLHKEQCFEIRVRNFPPPAVAKYDPTLQEQEYKAANPAKPKTAAQLQCMAEFEKESSRRAEGMKNIKLIADLSEDPVYSCITDKAQKPYDFDLYANNVLNNSNSLYAFFDMDRAGVVSYNITYPGFTVYNYGLDTVAYQVFKNLLAEKYKPGELMPSIDNNGNFGFQSNPELSSVAKSAYKNIDIYSIKAGTNYKAFVLGKTYIVIRYDGTRNAFISSDAADIIAHDIIDSSPYVPVKGKAPVSFQLTTQTSASTASVKITADKISDGILNLSSIGLGSKVKFTAGDATTNSKDVSIGSIAVSPNHTFAIVMIAVHKDTPPWDIYVAIVRMNASGLEVIKILTPKTEIARDLARDGRNANASFNAEITAMPDDSTFAIRYYDSSTQSVPNDISKHDVQYIHTYGISGNTIEKK